MMISITGKTYEWKSQLKNAGFSWNAKNKTWDRIEPLNPDGSWVEHVQILRGIESGDLRYASCGVMRSQSATERTRYELYEQYEHLAR